MSRMSRKLMEGAGASFLDRLSADIANRQAKLAAAARRAGAGPRFVPGSAAAEVEQEAKDISYLQWVHGEGVGRPWCI